MQVTGVEKFEADLKQFAERDITHAVLVETVAIAENVLLAAVYNTPLRPPGMRSDHPRGNLRGNWVVLLGRWWRRSDYRKKASDIHGAGTVARGFAMLKSARPFLRIVIANASPVAHLVEKGSIHNRAVYMLARAVERARSRRAAA